MRNIQPGCAIRWFQESALPDFDSGLGDSEAESGSAMVARSRLIDPIKAVEHTLAQFFGNSRSIIDHIDRDPLSIIRSRTTIVRPAACT
jgi:hypothetical protein